MKKFYKGIHELLVLGKGIFSFLICFVLAIVLLKSEHNIKQNFVDTTLSTILYPAQYVASRVQNYHSIISENEKLKYENVKLRVESDLNHERYLQSKRLVSLEQFSNKHNYDFLLAEVIAQTPSRYKTIVVINKGYNDSISVNMPVVTSNGIVGRISKVFAYHSHVKLLSDPVVKVSVIESRTRNAGILESPDAANLRVEISKHAEMKIGDTLYTSGYGGVFPKGLRVGTIKSFSKSNIEVLLYGEVSLFQSPDFLEEVFVLRMRDLWGQRLDLLDTNLVDSLVLDSSKSIKESAE